MEQAAISACSKLHMGSICMPAWQTLQGSPRGVLAARGKDPPLRSICQPGWQPLQPVSAAAGPVVRASPCSCMSQKSPGGATGGGMGGSGRVTSEGRAGGKGRTPCRGPQTPGRQVFRAWGRSPRGPGASWPPRAKALFDWLACRTGGLRAGGGGEGWGAWCVREGWTFVSIRLPYRPGPSPGSGSNLEPTPKT